ncbi:transposase family protein [Pseudonocardia sp. NPDC049635]|uniref:transposase family protein n=1 Tax=Pseudonocardia sp. NPDC049635 TaxID=3155506 RepID=UPI0033EC53CF
MTSASCPRCGTESRRVHAWHLRRLADLPVGGRPVVMGLRVRRLLCTDVQCPQRTFREQIPALASRYARRTLRLAATIEQVAVALAGRAGAALLATLGVSVSGRVCCAR